MDKTKQYTYMWYIIVACHSTYFARY